LNTLSSPEIFKIFFRLHNCERNQVSQDNGWIELPNQGLEHYHGEGNRVNRRDISVSGPAVRVKKLKYGSSRWSASGTKALRPSGILKAWGIVKAIIC